METTLEKNASQSAMSKYSADEPPKKEKNVPKQLTKAEIERKI